MRTGRLLIVASPRLLLALGFASASFLAVRQPLSLGDYLAVWGLKARVIHASGDLASVFRVDPAGEVPAPRVPAALAAPPRRDGEAPRSLRRSSSSRSSVPSSSRCRAPTLARTRAPLPWRLLAAASLTLLPYFQTAAYTGYAEALLVVPVLAALLLVESPSPTPFTAAAAGLLLALAALTKQEGVVARSSSSRRSSRRPGASATPGSSPGPASASASSRGRSTGRPTASPASRTSRLDAFGAGKPLRALATFSEPRAPHGSPVAPRRGAPPRPRPGGSARAPRPPRWERPPGQASSSSSRSRSPASTSRGSSRGRGTGSSSSRWRQLLPALFEAAAEPFALAPGE